MLQEFFSQAASYILRSKRFLSLQLNHIDRIVAGFSLAVLDGRGKSLLTTSIYNSKKDVIDKGLFDWEVEWFANDLPKSPAKILTGGSGNGREVKALLKMGYSVVAFDPAKTAVNAARQEIVDKNCLGYFVGSYEDLALDIPGGSDLHNNVQSFAPYDAVILGWGSFTHLSDRQTRISLIKKMAELCPHGPVLLSFWLRDDNTTVERGRSWRLGYRVGCMINRNKSTADLPPQGDDITVHAGYGHFFTMEEIDHLIEQCNYMASTNAKVSYLKSYPHLTITPQQKSE